MRLPARLLLTGAALLVSASCFGDKALAPSGVPTVGGNPALRALVVAQSVDLVIPANGGDLDIFGVYSLHFPAGSVCDPSASDTQTGYANAQWDAPCTPATGDIAIRATAKWSSSGRLSVDFVPSLRFVPNKHVTLSTDLLAPSVAYLDAVGSYEGWPINFAAVIDGPGVVDALTDPSLRTQIISANGRVSRRIKHFSGYYILMGDGSRVSCDPYAGDPACTWVEEGN